MPKVSALFISFLACIFLLSNSLSARNTSPGPKYKLVPTRKKTERLIKIYPVPGEGPVCIGGMKPITREQFEKVPYLKLKKRSRQLPESCNNGDEKYFPNPVVNQGAYGSCAQASGIGHHFTYVISLARDTVAGYPYPHNYTWNFLNGGVGGGSNFLDGWDIVNENGIPTFKTWGSGITADTKWLSGYDKYYSAMRNRYVEYNKIDVSTKEGIETLKQWIYDFGDGSPTGGCASFSCNCVPPMWDTTGMVQLPSGTPEAGWPIVQAWGHFGGHAMVIVGYHDSIRIDVNRDGEYTNDKDLNGDGKVDVKDWEIGGWLVANSWGNWDVKKGFFYMLYRTGALEPGNAYDPADTMFSQYGKIVDFDKGGFSSNKHVYTLRFKKVDDNIKRQLIYKINMNHTQRDQISISSGVSNNTGDNEPEFSHRHTIFNYQGGPLPMQGKNASSDIEIGLDVKELIGHIDKKEAKYFLSIDSKGGGTGKVASFSLIDYRGGSPVEKTCDQTDVDITQGTTTLSIVYESAMDPLTITTKDLPNAKQGEAYDEKLEASGGESPYKWELLKHVYYEVDNNNSFPEITDEVSPDDTDDGLAEVDLNFDFPFYGEKVKKVYVATDGHILFEPPFVYVRSAEALMATRCIAVLGADLVITSSDGLYCKSENDKVTVRWKTTHMWSETGLIDVDLDFAVVLYPSGKIEYFYGSNLSGDVSGMAVGASGGAGAHVVYDYGTLSDIPNGHKFGLMPEHELAGMSMSDDGKFNGTPTDEEGTYRVTFAVTDALLIKKVKSYNFNIGDISGIKNITPDVVSSMNIIHRSNASILFSFTTHTSARASLELYSVSGKKVQTMLNGRLQSGSHKVVLNLHDKGNTVANGIYMCRLQVGNRKVVRKISIVN